MSDPVLPIYLDCAATTPIEPEVADIVLHYMKADYGNPGSRTHVFGTRAKSAVEEARSRLAAVVNASPEEVIFTSGATESNNLAILGLAEYGRGENRRHVVCTAIEHKAVLDPMKRLAAQGFEVTAVPPTTGGYVDPDQVCAAVRPETLLVSVMHVNNETGVIQPLREIAARLGDHPCFFHTDAAQGYGKDLQTLANPRIDLISVSGHKLYAPKGIGALIARRRNRRQPPIHPLLFGGGQERGFRSGTLPVPLIAGFGLAAKLSAEAHSRRTEHNFELRRKALQVLAELGAVPHGDQTKIVPHILNASFPALDSEAVILALKQDFALSNGSACTSASYQPSHVLLAMGLPVDQVHGAVRISWCHLTPNFDWERFKAPLRLLM